MLYLLLLLSAPLYSMLSASQILVMNARHCMVSNGRVERKKSGLIPMENVTLDKLFVIFCCCIVLKILVSVDFFALSLP